MKKNILIVLILVISTFQLRAQTAPDNMSSFKWLIGTWERQDMRQDRSAFESWEQVSETELKGIGVSLSGKDTTFVEHLRMLIRSDTVYYVADVAHNPAPVFFRVTQLSDEGFTAENPSHDFPKRIEYILEGKSMTAIVSGDGKSIPFRFVWVEH